jgi:CPA2 family monovalent cation:H+ antiporter-2
MHETSAFLAGILIVSGAGLVATLGARVLRAPAIIGFLVAGMVIGPSGFGWVARNEVETVADLGLVLLLFTVGLELSPAPLFRWACGC